MSPFDFERFDAVFVTSEFVSPRNVNHAIAAHLTCAVEASCFRSSADVIRKSLLGSLGGLECFEPL